MKIEQAVMPGPSRSGSDSRGAVVHLIENPDGRSLAILGPALCGAVPKSDWVASADVDRPCPRCQRKLEKMQAAGDGDITP